MKNFNFLLTLILLFTSCSTTKQLSQAEIKAMTTKQYEANYDLVFSSSMSLLQSEGFFITNTDKSTGLINAFKEIDNKNSDLELFFLGTTKSSSNSNVAIFLSPINESITEVKITIYEGSTTRTSYSRGIENKTQNSMVQNAEIYNLWFNNLLVEIERRKALYGE